MHVIKTGFRIPGLCPICGLHRRSKGHRERGDRCAAENNKRRALELAKLCDLSNEKKIGAT